MTARGRRPERRKPKRRSSRDDKPSARSAIGAGGHDAYGRQPDIVLKLSGVTWAKLYLSEATLDDLIESGHLEVAAGTAADATRVLDAFDRYDPQKAVVVPPTTLVQDHM